MLRIEAFSPFRLFAWFCPFDNEHLKAVAACRSIHLTNDAIQKNYEHYDSFEDHNKLNLEAFQAILERQGETINVQNDLLPQMKDAAAHVFSATLPSLNSQCLSSCFELFGLDFMVDAQGKVCISLLELPVLLFQQQYSSTRFTRIFSWL